MTSGGTKTIVEDKSQSHQFQMLRVMPPVRAKRCGDCHHQQPLPHPNGHDEHEDSVQFNIVSHDYHDQRMDTDGAGVLGSIQRDIITGHCFCCSY